MGLTVDQVRPFLANLRRSGYTGDTALVVDRRLRRQVRRDPLWADVWLLPARTLLPCSFRELHRRRALWALWQPTQAFAWCITRAVGLVPLPAHARLQAQVAIAKLICTPMEARFLHYRRFLKLRPYAWVLLTDVRDVLFQCDPSDGFPEWGMAASIETARYTIATEPHNELWVRQAYGSHVLAKIGAKPVSCVGVTHGDGVTIAHYLDLMTQEILRLSASTARRGGADTAIHNVLLWTDQLGTVQLLETLASPVATLNGITQDDITLSSKGRLLNRDGSEPAVVHQYDRIPSLAPALLKVLAG